MSVMQQLPGAGEFVAFPKIARLSRECLITEKIDGTNAQIVIGEDGSIHAGSRNRWVTPQGDNYGFAAWVHDNREKLLNLGPGRHYGEWWGKGINRGYGLDHRRFSLFNAVRWLAEGQTNPAGICHLVPILYRGIFTSGAVEAALDMLRRDGSQAAPGFDRPEGVIVWHTAAQVGFKKTLLKDDEPKTT